MGFFLRFCYWPERRFLLEFIFAKYVESILIPVLIIRCNRISKECQWCAQAKQKKTCKNLKMKEIFWKSQGIWSVAFPTDEQLMNCQKWNKIKLHKAFISFHLNSKLCFVIWLTGRWFGRKSNRANVVKSEVTSATHRSGHWCDPNEQNPSKQVQTLEVTPSTEPMLLQSLLSFADVRRKRYDLAQPRKPRFRFNDQLWDHQWYMVNQFILPSVHQFWWNHVPCLFETDRLCSANLLLFKNISLIS